MSPRPTCRSDWNRVIGWIDVVSVNHGQKISAHDSQSKTASECAELSLIIFLHELAKYLECMLGPTPPWWD